MTATPLVGNTFFGLDVSQLGSKLMSLRRRLSKRLLLLEFTASGLRYAEAALSVDGIRFNHISRVPLPEEALDRGVPSDPAMMASLIRTLCQEKGIPAHRAAVVLSPDIAYQRTIELPATLSVEEARASVLAPANNILLPFPLEQTDFDLYPLPRELDSFLQPYLLTAIPQTLIDRVISMLDAAGMELQALELGPYSVMRFLVEELIGLRDSELYLVLELLPDCSQLCVVSSSGPVRLERLSAIRDFPDPELDDVQRKEALNSGLSAEDITIKDERYLPISELDLRTVLRDMKAVISELTETDDPKLVRGLSLSGINSAHPLIKDFFQEALGCDVKLIQPVLMPRVCSFTPDDLLIQTGLARLVGLGLGFLPQEQLLSSPTLATSLPTALVSPPTLPIDAIVDSQEYKSSLMTAPLDVEASQISPHDGVKFDADNLLIRVEEKQAVAKDLDKEVEREGEDEWPSLGLDLTVNNAVEKEAGGKVVEEEAGSEGEDEWPSLGLDLTENNLVEKDAGGKVVEEEAGSKGEEEWPSLGLDLTENNVVEKEAGGKVVEEEAGSEGEEEWPSLGLDLTENNAVEKEACENVVEEEAGSEGEEEWPGLGLDLTENIAVEKEASEKVVEEEAGSEGEDEWPSLGLDLTENNVVEKDAGGKVVEEEAGSEDEEEWPSINAIPDLQLAESPLEPQKAQPISSEDVLSDSSSLGELRFQDE